MALVDDNLSMRITSTANANKRQKDVAFFTLTCSTELESVGDAFLRSEGVDLSQGEVDRIDGESETTFLVDLMGQTKAKVLKGMRTALKEFTKKG